MLAVAAMGVVLSSCKDEEDPEEKVQSTIWTGSSLVFEKIDGVDWNLEANQDRMTDNVWITRANNKGIFNYKQELSYQGEDVYGVSPKDTKWAIGTTSDDLKSLNFMTWARLHQGFPQDLIGRDLVVYLETDDIYLDLKFTSWASGEDGGKGGFAYIRSTP